jgi:predicted alpha/beta superfamily hydrolase
LSDPPSGDVQVHRVAYPPGRHAEREVTIYLPPNYAAEAQARYPVLYLHDGQNLFDPSTAFLGNHWRLKEVADELICARQIQPLIIAGIYNAREHRINEYTPVPDRRGYGGQAAAYGRLILKRIKSFIDDQYRTLHDAANTGLGGSSLGGLITLHLGLRHPRTFGKLIVMSPSVWWAGRAILKDIEKLRRQPRLKIWLDIGTNEGLKPNDYVRDVAKLREALTRKGWQLGRDLSYLEDEGAGHNEKAWGFRMQGALKFLFPPATPVERPAHQAPPRRSRTLAR